MYLSTFSCTKSVGIRLTLEISYNVVPCTYNAIWMLLFLWHFLSSVYCPPTRKKLHLFSMFHFDQMSIWLKTVQINLPSPKWENKSIVISQTRNSDHEELWVRWISIYQNVINLESHFNRYCPHCQWLKFEYSTTSVILKYPFTK